MTPDSWQKLKTLFYAALELEPAERALFLTQSCGDDGELRRQIEKLLASHDCAGSFLAEPAMVDAGVVSAGPASTATEADQRVGQRIGPYEIIRELGHGGMGTVFLAVRADDQYRKQVAIKLVNRGMDTDLILRRFMMERQILANLEHPNIARLLEGGSTLDGLPYFVMEYIDGRPITEYCDDSRFNLTARLELFRQVCSALQYAHQNLVVHRDIKPSNILVTPEGVPKLLDFGIAKLLSPGWAADTGEATASMVRLMTPEYASPEQLRGLAITTASDVYSLGIVLFELLSGHHPYRLDSRRPDEIAAVILREEPEKPSTAAGRQKQEAGKNATQQDQHTTDNRPGTGEAIPQSSLRNPKALRGDLDNIVLKALRKEPERRYASVLQLAEDIRRHLDGLPVTATPDTFRYRAGKFILRNRAAAMAATVLVITLIAATGITAWQARVARRERDKAQSRFNQVRKLANKVVFEYSDGIEKLDGSTPLREKMVKDASEYLDALTQEAGGDPELGKELAAAYQKLGDVQGGSSQANVGDRDGAIRSYGKALAILESTLPARADKPLLLDVAALHGKLYQALWKMGRQPEAEEHMRRSLSMREQLVLVEPANVTYRLGLARGYRDFGGTLASKTKKDGDGAIAYLRKSNELCESIVTDDPANLEARAIAGLGYRMLGAEFEFRNDAPQAGEYYRKALGLTQEREKLDPNNAQIQVVLADCYSNIGRALMLQRNETGALEYFHRALSVFASRFAKDPDNALVLMNLSQTYNNLGNVLAQSGKFTNALENYQLALGLRERYIKAHPQEANFKTRLGETTFDLGDLYAQMAGDGRTSASKKLAQWQEAKSWYQRSNAIWQELSKNGTLPGYYSQKPDEVSKALARCDAALAESARK